MTFLFLLKFFVNMKAGQLHNPKICTKKRAKNYVNVTSKFNQQKEILLHCVRSWYGRDCFNSPQSKRYRLKFNTCWVRCTTMTNEHTTTNVWLLTTALGFILQLRNKWNKLIGARNFLFFFYNIVDKTLKCIVIVHRLFIFHTISCIKLDASIIKIISVNQAKEAKFVFSLKKDIL